MARPARLTGSPRDRNRRTGPRNRSRRGPASPAARRRSARAGAGICWSGNTEVPTANALADRPASPDSTKTGQAASPASSRLSTREANDAHHGGERRRVRQLAVRRRQRQVMDDADGSTAGHAPSRAPALAAAGASASGAGG